MATHAGTIVVAGPQRGAQRQTTEREARGGLGAVDLAVGQGDRREALFRRRRREESDDEMLAEPAGVALAVAAFAEPAGLSPGAPSSTGEPDASGAAVGSEPRSSSSWARQIVVTGRRRRCRRDGARPPR